MFHLSMGPVEPSDHSLNSRKPWCKVNDSSLNCFCYFSYNKKTSKQDNLWNSTAIKTPLPFPLPQPGNHQVAWCLCDSCCFRYFIWVDSFSCDSSLYEQLILFNTVPFSLSLLWSHDSIFFFKILNSIIERVGYILFLRPCIDGHLNFLFLLGTVNRILWMWAWKCTFEQHALNSFGWIPITEIVGLRGNSIFNFSRNLCTVCHSNDMNLKSHQ